MDHDMFDQDALDHRPVWRGQAYMISVDLDGDLVVTRRRDLATTLVQQPEVSQMLYELTEAVSAGCAEAQATDIIGERYEEMLFLDDPCDGSVIEAPAVSMSYGFRDPRQTLQLLRRALADTVDALLSEVLPRFPNGGGPQAEKIRQGLRHFAQGGAMDPDDVMTLVSIFETCGQPSSYVQVTVNLDGKITTMTQTYETLLRDIDGRMAAESSFDPESASLPPQSTIPAIGDSF